MGCAVVEQRLVNFVGNEIDLMFDGNISDGFECLKIVCRAGGVARTVNEDRFCLWGDSRFDLIGCHAEVLRRRSSQ